MNGKFYITTPIYYPSNKLTLGNCYTTVVCDAIARFYRALGRDVFYLTGTDEHGQKIQKTASQHGKSEKEYLDEIVADTKELWKSLNISYDKFIRTTDPEHEACAQKVFKELYDKGYIYKSKYSGHYCVPCESFWTQSQLVDGKCPDCGREVIVQEEESYFFKLSEFADKLLKLYEENPNFLKPASRVNEMVNNFIKPGLQDLCVSRTTVDWGVRVPFDPKHTIYVWIDALTNYISALGYGTSDDSNFKKFWPADVHVVGKEIVRFHAIIWPAILMALDLPLPKEIFGHGWMLIGGDKLSKSKDSASKEVVDPRVLIPRYSADSVRYYLCREIPFGSDGSYTTENFLKRINTDLCNNYGNLISRTFSMLKKYFNSIVPLSDRALAKEEDTAFEERVLKLKESVMESMKEYDVTKALIDIFDIFDAGNKYIEVTMPWVLNKEDPERLKLVISNLLDSIRIGSLLLAPFLPDCTKKVLSAYGIEKVSFDALSFGEVKAGTQILPIEILFPRLDIEEELKNL